MLLNVSIIHKITYVPVVTVLSPLWNNCFFDKFIIDYTSLYTILPWWYPRIAILHLFERMFVVCAFGINKWFDLICALGSPYRYSTYNKPGEVCSTPFVFALCWETDLLDYQTSLSSVVNVIWLSLHCLILLNLVSE